MTTSPWGCSCSGLQTRVSDAPTQGDHLLCHLWKPLTCRMQDRQQLMLALSCPSAEPAHLEVLPVLKDRNHLAFSHTGKSCKKRRGGKKKIYQRFSLKEICTSSKAGKRPIFLGEGDSRLFSPWLEGEGCHHTCSGAAFPVRLKVVFPHHLCLLHLIQHRVERDQNNAAGIVPILQGWTHFQRWHLHFIACPTVHFPVLHFGGSTGAGNGWAPSSCVSWMPLVQHLGRMPSAHCHQV